MHKIYFFLLIALFAGCSDENHAVSSEDENSSGETENVITWRLSDSPIIIDSDYIVPKNKTLKIEPGVIVKIKSTGNVFGTSEVSIWVKGGIIAEGTIQDSIVFTYQNEGRYSAIVLDQTDSSDNIFKYCIFENSDWGLTFVSSNGMIQNCRFKNNDLQSIGCHNGSNPLIEENKFESDNGGIYVGSNSNPIILNNTINVRWIGISIENVSNPTIQNNIITGSFGATKGINCYSSSAPLIEKNIFQKFYYGINCNYSSPTINNNSFINNYIGINCETNSNTSPNPNILNNDYTGNEYDTTCINNDG